MQDDNHSTNDLHKQQLFVFHMFQPSFPLPVAVYEKKGCNSQCYFLNNCKLVSSSHLTDASFSISNAASKAAFASLLPIFPSAHAAVARITGRTSLSKTANNSSTAV